MRKAASRPTSPIKNAVLEVGPKGFYFSAELPERKIVPKGQKGGPVKVVMQEGKSGKGAEKKKTAMSGEKGITKQNARAKVLDRLTMPSKAVATREVNTASIPDSNTTTPSRPPPKPTTSNYAAPAGKEHDLATTPIQHTAPRTSKDTPRVTLTAGSVPGSPQVLIPSLSSSPKGRMPTRDFPSNIGEMIAGLSLEASGTMMPAEKDGGELVDVASSGEAPTLLHKDPRRKESRAGVTSHKASESNLPYNRIHTQTVKGLSKPCGKRLGTPPAIRAAMEYEMDGMRSSLRTSIRSDYFSKPKSRSSPSVDSASLAQVKVTEGTPTAKPNPALRHRLTATKSESKATPTAKKTVQTAQFSATKTPVRARLTKASPTIPMSASNSLPRAARMSIFDTPSRSPAPKPTPTSTLKRTMPILSHDRARNIYPTTPKIMHKEEPYDPASDPRPHEEKFAGAKEIASLVEEWNSSEKSNKVEAAQLRRIPKPPLKSRTKTPAKPTGTSSAKPKQAEKESYTPEGSPTKPASPIKNLKVRPTSTGLPHAKAPRTPANTPRTPVPNKSAMARMRARGGVRTPSKEVQSKLDRVIDQRIDEDARAGRVFTPGGQRISELLERRGDLGNRTV